MGDRVVHARSDGLSNGPKLEPTARDPEIWSALGQMTVYFAMLEGQLQFTVWTLLNVGSDIKAADMFASQNVARIVLAGRPFSALVDMFCSLCQERKVHEHRLNILRGDLMRVGEVRNRYIHSEWDAGDGQPGTAGRFRFTAKARDGLKFSYERVTAEDIRRLADEIGQVALRVAWLKEPEALQPPGLWPDRDLTAQL